MVNRSESKFEKEARERVEAVEMARGKIAVSVPRFLIMSQPRTSEGELGARDVLLDAYYSSMLKVKDTDPAHQVDFDHAHGILLGRLYFELKPHHNKSGEAWYSQVAADKRQSLFESTPGSLDRLEIVVHQPLTTSEVDRRGAINWVPMFESV